MWEVIVGVICGVLALFILLGIFLAIIIELSYRRVFYKRADGAITIDYAQFKEFQNLERRKIIFQNNKKDNLIGFVYNRKKTKEYKGVIVFVHGIGFGHSYLFNMIDYLCASGFLVFAYDMTGSGLSGGKYVSSLLQAVPDIKCALNAVKKDPQMAPYPLYLFGHSWGGYAVLNALHFEEYNIQKVVSVSGFNSEIDLVKGKGKSNSLQMFLMNMHNKLHFKEVSKLTSFDALKKTNAKVLYLQGENDFVVNPKYSGLLFSKIERDNIKVIMYPNKGHSPFVQKDKEDKASVVLKDYGIFGEREPKQNIKIVDYRELSIPDLDVYKTIVDFYLN